MARKEVWKFELKPELVNKLLMPRGAKILAVQVQKGIPCIWAEVFIDTATEQRVFHVIGTGQSLPVNATKHWGTFQVENGYLVWHVYEEERK